MNTPPPLPATTAFVTVLGRVSIVLAVLGLLWALVQVLFVLMLPMDLLAQVEAQPGMPALLAAAMQYRSALALAMLALSLGLLVVSWGLLQRREWGRLGFIAALVLGAVVNFAALLLVGPFFDSLQDLFPPGMADPGDGWQIDAQLRMTRNLVMASGLIGALAIAGVHGWLVWKLCTAQVRAEFRRHGV